MFFEGDLGGLSVLPAGKGHPKQLSKLTPMQGHWKIEVQIYLGNIPQEMFK